MLSVKSKNFIENPKKSLPRIFKFSKFLVILLLTNEFIFFDTHVSKNK